MSLTFHRSTQRSSKLFIFMLICCLPLICQARPQLVTQEKVDGDTTIRLTLEDQFILDDQNTPCKVEVIITGDDKPMVMGDRVHIKVYEDDVPLTSFGDDLLWEIEEVFSAEEIEVQRFERTYQCNTAGLRDWIGGVEIYAQANVDKAECGFFCGDDPSTSNIGMDQMDDDMAEDDDSLSAAFLPPRQGVANRIAKDPDWFQITYTTPINLMARVVSRFEGGMLRFTLMNEMGSVIEEAVLEEGGAALRLEPRRPILPGEYFLQIIPADMNDYNFYDLEITESIVQTDCAAGTQEERPCTLCGVERRTCSDVGEWGVWGNCENSGVCEPGAEEVRSCGEEGSQGRVCQSDCSWGMFSSCDQCEDGTEEMCYSGPEGTSGIGQCRMGVRVCTRGTWSACQGDVWPSSELCSDGVDNDCDGTTDLQDPECVGSLGAACHADHPCAKTLTCLDAPFIDGYCGLVGCEGCEGVCANVLGATYCLTSCDTIFDCRPGYLCSMVGMNGEKACAPPCLMDSDCGEGEQCSEMSICVTGDGMTPMPMGGSMGENMGGMNPNVMIVSPPAEEGCTQSNQRLHFQFFLLFGLFLLRDRRRQVG